MKMDVIFLVQAKFLIYSYNSVSCKTFWLANNLTLLPSTITNEVHYDKITEFVILKKSNAYGKSLSMQFLEFFNYTEI